MAEPGGWGRLLPALALTAAGGLVVALQFLPLTGLGAAPVGPSPVTAGPLTPGSDASPSSEALASLPAATSQTPTVSAVTASVLSFKQDALLDPMVTGKVAGASGVLVAAQVWLDGAWSEQGSTRAAADGTFSVALNFGHAQLRTDRWRLVAEGVASPDITVQRLGLARPTVRPVTQADVTHSWRAGCPIHYSQLRLVDVNHYGFDGLMHRGQLVVQAKVVDRFVGLLQNTIDNRFPLRTLRTVEAFRGDDIASGDANNTSAFNCRMTTGGTRWSDHAYGVAIDINPIENPYTDGQILPAAGKAYLDRTNLRPGMLTAASPVIRYALANGWAWLSPYDFQHLEVVGAR